MSCFSHLLLFFAVGRPTWTPARRLVHTGPVSRECLSSMCRLSPRRAAAARRWSPLSYLPRLKEVNSGQKVCAACWTRGCPFGRRMQTSRPPTVPKTLAFFVPRGNATRFTDISTLMFMAFSFRSPSGRLNVSQYPPDGLGPGRIVGQLQGRFKVRLVRNPILLAHSRPCWASIRPLDWDLASMGGGPGDRGLGIRVDLSRDGPHPG